MQPKSSFWGLYSRNTTKQNKMLALGFLHLTFISNMIVVRLEEGRRAYRKSEFWFNVTGLALGSLLTYLTFG